MLCVQIFLFKYSVRVVQEQSEVRPGKAFPRSGDIPYVLYTAVHKCATCGTTATMEAIDVASTCARATPSSSCIRRCGGSVWSALSAIYY